MQLRSDPYVWVTWLTKLLAGENSCEWASWFQAHYQGFQKLNSFDEATHKLKHTPLLNAARTALETEGYNVFTEGQNSFVIKGKTATLGGKPDLIAIHDGRGIICDVKTGQPRPEHNVQVMIYMYAIPKALLQYQNIAFDGRLVYADHEVSIARDSVDRRFPSQVGELIQRLGSATPARKVPSVSDCRFCNITAADCPERIDAPTNIAHTSDF